MRFELSTNDVMNLRNFITVLMDFIEQHSDLFCKGAARFPLNVGIKTLLNKIKDYGSEAWNNKITGFKEIGLLISRTNKLLGDSIESACEKLKKKKVDL